MDEEKAIIYAVIAVCIIGAIVVGYFAITSPREPYGFTELYFEEHEELPSIMEVGSEYAIPFTVVSHEKDLTFYNYTLTIGENYTLEKASFKLNPEESITLCPSFIPENTTLTLKEVRSSIESSVIEVSNIFPAFLLSYNKTEGEVLLPIGIPMMGTRVEMIFEIDPDKEQSWNFSYTKKEETIPLEPDANLTGFNIQNHDVVVKNEYGKVEILDKTTTFEYRYEPLKFSVNIISDKNETYEIHFWTSVREPTMRFS